MRFLYYFAGAAVVVAIGGAVAGAAIDTTPRQIHGPPPVPEGSGIAFDRDRGPQALTANHYPLEADGRRIEVAKLRERGLYSQERYAPTFYAEDTGADAAFDFDAAAEDQRQWEAEQQRATTTQQREYIQAQPAQRRPLDLQRPAKVAQPQGTERQVEYVSRPVIQDTSGMRD